MRPQIISYGLFIALVICNTAHSATEKKAVAEGKTAFKIDPLKALQSPLLATPETAMTATEFDLLQHASLGKMEHWSMARAALVISGVTDEEEQKPYLAQIAEIIEGSKEATAEAHTDLAKAKALGKYLIENPLSAGYDSDSYRLPKLLETKHFNCVSSAILYSIMAQKCGLEVRAVTKSSHVFLRALDFDIEPTNGKVYSIADRNDRFLWQDQGEKPMAAYATFPYRETSKLGLLSTLYQDEGGVYRRGKNYEAAVTWYLKAACFDPKDPSTLQNLRTTLENWSKDCKAKHQNAKAAKVDAFAKSMLRDPSILNTYTSL